MDETVGSPSSLFHFVGFVCFSSMTYWDAFGCPRILFISIVVLQDLDFPGGRVAFTTELSFISESDYKRIPCYRVLDDNGVPIMDDTFQQVKQYLSIC